MQRTTECSWSTPCREPAPNATPASGPERDFSAIRGRCYRSECSRGCRCGRLGLRTSRPLGQTVLVSPSTQSFVTETGALGGPALLVHGGAGTFERLRDGASRARLESGLASALEAGWDVLQRGEGMRSTRPSRRWPASKTAGCSTPGAARRPPPKASLKLTPVLWTAPPGRPGPSARRRGQPTRSGRP